MTKEDVADIVFEFLTLTAACSLLALGAIAAMAR